MITSQKLHPQYLKNAEGVHAFVVLPSKEYEELLEDYNDLLVIAERRDEKKISLTELRNELKSNE